MAYKLTKEIACPRCGETENLSLGGGEVYESFFGGSIGEGCVCDECGQEFTVWFTVSEIDWDEEDPCR